MTKFHINKMDKKAFSLTFNYLLLTKGKSKRQKRVNVCVYLCLLLKLFTPYLNCASVFQWFLGSRPSHCSLISAMAAFRRAVGAVSTPTSRRPLGGVQSDSITYTNKNINKSSRVPSTMFQIYMR